MNLFMWYLGVPYAIMSCRGKIVRERGLKSEIHVLSKNGGFGVRDPRARSQIKSWCWCALVQDFSEDRFPVNSTLKQEVLKTWKELFYLSKYLYGTKFKIKICNFHDVRLNDDGTILDFWLKIAFVRRRTRQVWPSTNIAKRSSKSTRQRAEQSSRNEAWAWVVPEEE